ncbi:cytochrome P450 [Kitasatospora sp. NPDC088346]|uniref:cytochrome P450 n=1 Tax=Kitasatospora sp. NPDC088346 TaxID=3364073 RepID=UPI00380C8430
MVLRAADRDPAVFPDPDRLDPTRPPRRHLTFGHGRHFCAGARFAEELVTAGLETALDLGHAEPGRQADARFHRTAGMTRAAALTIRRTSR